MTSPLHDGSGRSSSSSRLDDPRVAEAVEQYLALCESGKKPDRKEFLARFSDVAEELDADLERFEACHAPVDEAYNNPLFGMMGTGGSTCFLPLR